MVDVGDDGNISQFLILQMRIAPVSRLIRRKGRPAKFRHVAKFSTCLLYYNYFPFSTCIVHNFSTISKIVTGNDRYEQQNIFVSERRRPGGRVDKTTVVGYNNWLTAALGRLEGRVPGWLERRPPHPKRIRPRSSAG